MVYFWRRVEGALIMWEECIAALDEVYICTRSAEMVLERKDSDRRSGVHTINDDEWTRIDEDGGGCTLACCCRWVLIILLC